MITDALLELIKNHEGFSSKPYEDTKGKLTVGYGRNLDANPLTLDEVVDLFHSTEFLSDSYEEDFFDKMLKTDVEEHIEELIERIPWLASKPKNIQRVLYDMAYNLGVSSLMKFTGTLVAVQNDDWVMAAYEILDSKYAEDVKTRAVTNAKIVAGGQYQEAIDLLSQRNTARFEALKKYL